MDIPRFIRLREVTTLTGLSRSTVYRLANEGRFPKAVKLGVRASGWRENEVREWIESRAA